MDRDECYEVLGVSPGATRSEVKRAFRKLALRYSPDRHPDNKAAIAKYREIVAAYQKLAQPEDREGEQPASAEEKPKVRGFKSFKDIFAAFDEPGDMRGEIHLTRSEARRGGERTIRLRRFRVCEVCHGRGSESPCKKCGGAGKIGEEIDIRLQVPAGIKNGALLKLPGEGDLKGENGSRSDVYCRVIVE